MSVFFFFSLLFFGKSDGANTDEEPDIFIWDDLAKSLEGSIDWNKAEKFDIIILGSGPAGSTAALYTGRANLKTAVFHGNLPGGQLMMTTEIDNFPGFKGTGPELVKKIQEQAMNAGAKYIHETVTKVDLSTKPFKIETDLNKGYFATSIIIATGATPRYLGLPKEDQFKNRGISVCATCDGALFEKQDVAVVGGGNTALHEAVYLSNICKSVKLFVRSPQVTASPPLKAQLDQSSVQVFYDTEVVDLGGTNYLTYVETKNRETGERRKHNVAALFLAIGQTPNTKLFEEQLKLDDYSFIQTDGTPATSVPGVFAAGDCANRNFRQAAAAVGYGCQAALLAEQYVMSERASNHQN